jgi:hypothetical protein
LIAQKRFSDAEPFLMSAYTGMSVAGRASTAATKADLRRTIALIEGLYESWGKKAEATKWRNRRDDLGFPDDPFARP